jgi:hypothetical protein
MTDKVNIVGTGAGWEDAPLDELSWGINDGALLRSFDTVFNMHDLTRQDYLKVFAKSLDAVRRTDTPLMTLSEYPDIPSSQAYPLQEVMARFDTDYFANGICYMIAYALYTGKTQIDFYGVNMTSSHEYLTLERPCVEYWLGRAEGMGVKCNVHGLHSTILGTSDSRLYGYGYFQMSTLITEEDKNGTQHI